MNDYIVYPTQGVGKIIGIEEIKIKNQKKQYYVIEIMEKKLIIKLPVENVEAAGIRNVIDKNEIKKVLKILEQEAEIPEEDWKIRYQNNLQKIKSGSIFEIAKVCRNLYKRAKDKELSLMERRLYETAFSLVTGEIAIAKGISLEESKNLVSDILSK
ncbi:MAG: transcriptional regulator [Leptospiraceae bacterium]|nr:transcriptional regulator [Leptospiraceae bacterium]MDW7976037.1 CarD family transcriptional regulator [Leptospiraceae bacterium]